MERIKNFEINDNTFDYNYFNRYINIPFPTEKRKVLYDYGRAVFSAKVGSIDSDS
jgi:hypothetical protein